MPESPTAKFLWLRRVGWLVLIWGLSVAALAVVAGLFRMFMGLAGLTL
ncbi:DUF2474 domain-containing protein [Phyllobacterium phragmitis]|uniref:DUF2474 domain-containing protein n=1 Tax=Phyllobacterium phragmitis TaxID=2670329 RepID=A0A2S9IKK4_9HYPH|nr:DUF2474 domain-containing protein [Phyllobacterium phragmitis]PRD41063.1 DUF2474 domain-containing protein [Phyllobacterium phragmitis]